MTNDNDHPIQAEIAPMLMKLDGGGLRVVIAQAAGLLVHRRDVSDLSDTFAAILARVRKSQGQDRLSAVTARVAAEHGLLPADLRGPARVRAIAWPRQQAYAELREAGYSFHQIGGYFRRDHTTVLQGARAYVRRQVTNERRKAS